MKTGKFFFYASMLALCACGGNKQGESESAQSDGNTSVAAPMQDCDEITRMVTFYQNSNPFSILKSVEDVESEVNECKKLTKAVLYSGKMVDVTFKQYQQGEGNQGTIVSSNYRDEWTGVEYESKYRTSEEYGEESGFLFDDAYIASHHVAKSAASTNAQLSADEESFIKEHYPNLTIERVCQVVTYEDGDAKIFTVQFKPENKKALAINVFEKGGRFYLNEDWGVAEDATSVWNVDDEGEYHYPSFTVMVANDLSHYDLYYDRAAIESYSIGKYTFKQDSLVSELYESYYVAVDYNSRKTPSYWQVKREWEKIFECTDCMATEYAVVDLNEDGTKELLCRNKQEGQIAVFQFIGGSIDLYTCNYLQETSSLINLELYKNGVLSSGGVAVLAIQTVALFNQNGGITKYYEVAGGPTLEYSKQLYGEPEPIDASVYEAEKGKLKDPITDWETFDWKAFRE